MSGPSQQLDPAIHAYRRDLADVCLAGQVIASHYAEPLMRVLTAPAVLRSGPAEDEQAIADLQPGEQFALLDCNRGWAWGYGGAARRVGYLRSDALGAA